MSRLTRWKPPLQRAAAGVLVGRIGAPGRPLAAEKPQSAVAISAAAYKSVLLEGVPHVRQRPDFCGEACAAMWLARLGHRIDQNDVFNASGLNPELGRGCYTRELHAALVKIGF